MYNGHTVGVVVPAYNEQGLVGEVIDTMPDYVDRVYVVDDRSTDGTWQEIRDRAAAANRTAEPERAEPTIADGGRVFSRRVVPVRHETNRGVGGAIKTGYRRAYDDGIDVTAVMAGDGQMDPDQLPRLLDPIVNSGVDYAKGNRLIHPDCGEVMPTFRLVGNVMLSTLTKIASGYWETTDPQNGFTAISYRALDNLDVESLYDDYGFANELLVRLNQHGMQVADVPVSPIYGDEESTIEYHTFVPRVSKLLLVNFCRRLGTQFVETGTRLPAVCYAVATIGFAAALFAAPVAGLGAAAALLAVGAVALVAAASFDRAANRHLELQATAGTEIRTTEEQPNRVEAD